MLLDDLDFKKQKSKIKLPNLQKLYFIGGTLFILLSIICQVNEIEIYSTDGINSKNIWELFGLTGVGFYAIALLYKLKRLQPSTISYVRFATTILFLSFVLYYYINFHFKIDSLTFEGDSEYAQHLISRGSDIPLYFILFGLFQFGFLSFISILIDSTLNK